MEPLIPDPTGQESIPEVAKEVEVLVAQLDSASTLEAIQARELTTMRFEEKILQIRPSSHWGLNE
jgi:hypothetical protein